MKYDVMIEWFDHFGEQMTTSEMYVDEKDLSTVLKTKREAVKALHGALSQFYVLPHKQMSGSFCTSRDKE